MKRYSVLAIFLITFIVYFAVATQFTFKPKWALDYFNPLAQSIIHGRFDIVNSGTTYDLVLFQGKWYAPWGILSSLFLIPLQILKKQFVPTIYLSVIFSSLNVVVVYLLLHRLKKEFFHELRYREIYLLLILFAFGTTHFYVGTLGSVWHVDQMVTNFFGTLSIFFIFRNKRTIKDYLFSVISASIALLGRATIVLLVIIPAFFYAWDYIFPKRISWTQRRQAMIKGIFLFGIPLVFFTAIFFAYNWLRFGSPFEYGYRFIQESSYLAEIRERRGIMSPSNVPMNLWHMIFAFPSFTWKNGLKLNFDLKGNSIFFLTPPFLAIFWATPWKKIGKRITLNPYVSVLWLAAIVTMIPSLLIYSTGWMQFGYRYSLDITVILLLLSVFGMKGRLSALYILGIGFSIAMYWMGIHALT